MTGEDNNSISTNNANRAIISNLVMQMMTPGGQTYAGNNADGINIQIHQEKEKGESMV